MESAAIRVKVKGTNFYLPTYRADAVTSGGAAGVSPYDGASQASRVVRWQGSSASPNALLSGSLATLRNRSRERRRNDGMADAGIETLVSNIVGAGIKPQFRTRDAALNKALAALWLEWTDFSDDGNQFDFYGQQALACSSMITGGDMFARLRARLPEDGLPVPLQLQLLSSDFCPVEKTEPGPGGNYIVNGVEFNAIGKRVAYWLYREHPGDVLMRRYDAMPVRVPADQVIHMAVIKEIGVVRGEPWLARALTKLHDLDQYDDAQLTRQKIGNLFAGFVRPSAEGFFGGQTDPDAEQKAIAPLEPGMMQELLPGEDITWSDPPDAGTGYEAFNRAQYSHVAASIGVLYEQLTGDYRGVNDRTWRAALNEFGTRLGRWQHHTLIFQFCRPVLAAWANFAVLSGAIRLPDGVTVKDVVAAKWLPPARPYINPVQDVQARRDEVRAGFRSRSEVISERGYDAEVVDAEIAADNARADALGLTLDSDPRATAQNGQTSQPAVPDPADPQEDDMTREDMVAAIRAIPQPVMAPAAAPVVNVAAPAVTVNNHIPRRGDVVKTAQYDDSGRLSGMVEKEVSE